jgi:hypothetical protein
MLSSPFELLAKSWRLYRANFWTYFGYASWLLLPLAIILVLTTLPKHVIVDALTITISIAQVFVALWIVISLIRFTYELAENKSPDLARLSKESVTRIPNLLATAFLQLLIVLGGVLLFVIPGFIFWVWYAFAQMTTVIEGSRPVEALTASRALVRGRFFPVLWRLVCGPIVVCLLYSVALGSLLYAISLGLGFDLISVFSEDPPVWALAIEGIAEVIIFPLLLVYSVILYRDLKTNPVIEPDKACDVN